MSMLEDKASVTGWGEVRVGLGESLKLREERRKIWSKCGLQTEEKKKLSDLESQIMRINKSKGLKENIDFKNKFSLPSLGKNFDTVFLRENQIVAVEEIEKLRMQTKKESFLIILKNLEKKMMLANIGVSVPFLITTMRSRKFKNRTIKFSLDAALLGLEKDLLIVFNEEPFLSKRNSFVKNLITKEVKEELKDFINFNKAKFTKEIRKRRKFLRNGATGELKRPFTSKEIEILDKLRTKFNINIKEKVLLKSRFETFCVPDGKFKLDNKNWFVLIEGKLLDAIASSFMLKEAFDSNSKILCIVSSTEVPREIAQPSIFTKFIDKIIPLSQLQ